MSIDDARPGAAAGVTTNTGSPAKKSKSTALRKKLDGARARDGGPLDVLYKDPASCAESTTCQARHQRPRVSVQDVTRGYATSHE